MKTTYNRVFMEVVTVDTKDIITTSTPIETDPDWFYKGEF